MTRKESRKVNARIAELLADKRFGFAADESDRAALAVDVALAELRIARRQRSEINFVIGWCAAYVGIPSALFLVYTYFLFV